MVSGMEARGMWVCLVWHAIPYPLPPLPPHTQLLRWVQEVGQMARMYIHTVHYNINPNPKTNTNRIIIIGGQTKKSSCVQVSSPAACRFVDHSLFSELRSRTEMAPPIVFQITITNGDKPFNPGCYITGNVVVKTVRRKKLLGIRLLLHGNSYVNPFLRRDAGDGNEGQVMVGRHLDCNVKLYGGGGGYLWLEAGFYHFPFAVRLPQVSLPSSFESVDGAVRYWVEVRMVKKSRVYTTTKAFIIQERMDLNVGRDNLFLPKSGEIHKTFRSLSGRTGPLILTASTDRSGYCPGEKILMTTHLENNSSKEVKKVKATLLCRMTYFRHSRSHVEDTLVAQLRACQHFGAGHHTVWVHYPLPIPQGILPSSHTSKMIHTDYVLVVKVTMPALSDDVYLTMPIVVGTEPLLPQRELVERSRAAHPRYQASAAWSDNDRGITLRRRETWGGLPSYSLLPMASVGLPMASAMLPEPDAPPPYTPYPTSMVGPPTSSLSANRPSAPLQESSTASPSVSAPLQESSTASPSVSAPPQESSTASPSVSAPPQESSTASPSVSAPPQESSTASPSVSAPPQESSTASPSVSAPPQESSTASPSVNAPPQESSTVSPSVSAPPQETWTGFPSVSAPPQETWTGFPSVSAPPPYQPDRPHVSAGTSQIFLERPLVPPDRPRSATFSGRQRPRRRTESNSFLAQLL